MARLIATYCAEGPYRHLRDLDARRLTWFPWGYRAGRVAPGLEPRSGDVVELWELDDIRDPARAESVLVAEVDYVSQRDGYLALTLFRRDDLRAEASSSAVLGVARRHEMLAAAPPHGGDCGCEKSARALA